MKRGTIALCSSQVALGFQDNLQVWAIRTQPELYLVRQSLWQSEPGDRSQPVVGCSPNRFATNSYEGTLRIYNAVTAQIEQTYQEQGSTIRLAAFNADRSQLAFVNETADSSFAGGTQFNGRIALWNWNGHSEPNYLALSGP